jgi:type I restriction enzyme S subunit
MTDANAPYELPDGWTWKNLADVVEIGSEQVIPQKTPRKDFNYVALENVEQGTGRLIDFKPTRGEEIKSNKYAFTPKHVLYGKLRPYLRKVLAPDFDGVSATDLLPLLPREDLLERKFLLWWLLSPDVLEYVVGKQTGVKMPRLRTGDLHRLPIPLPPLSEQRRIVARIEALLAESRTARDALERVPALLKRFRQSVLAAAFRGDLTERDPNDEPASALSVDNVELQELPTGWTWVQLGDYLTFVGSGITPKGGQKVYQDSGVPFIRSQNVYPDGLRLDDVAYVSPKLHEEMSRTHLQANDVLLNITGASIGRSTVVPASLGQANVNQHVCILRTHPTLDSNYLSRFLNSPFGQDQITESQSGVTRQGLNYAQIRSLFIPLAPLAQQRRIVAKIEALFAQADAIERAVTIARKRADKIDQAILARAFRGEL